MIKENNLPPQFINNSLFKQNKSKDLLSSFSDKHTIKIFDLLNKNIKELGKELKKLSIANKPSWFKKEDKNEKLLKEIRDLENAKVKEFKKGFFIKAKDIFEKLLNVGELLAMGAGLVFLLTTDNRFIKPVRDGIFSMIAKLSTFVVEGVVWWWDKKGGKEFVTGQIPKFFTDIKNGFLDWWDNKGGKDNLLGMVKKITTSLGETLQNNKGAVALGAGALVVANIGPIIGGINLLLNVIKLLSFGGGAAVAGEAAAGSALLPLLANPYVWLGILAVTAGFVAYNVSVQKTKEAKDTFYERQLDKLKATPEQKAEFYENTKALPSDKTPLNRWWMVGGPAGVGLGKLLKDTKIETPEHKRKLDWLIQFKKDQENVRKQEEEKTKDIVSGGGIVFGTGETSSIQLSSEFQESLKKNSPVTTTPNFGSAIANTNFVENARSFDKFIAKSAKKYNIDADLIKAIIAQESRGNPFAQSPAGASGLMQLMPINKGLIEGGWDNVFDPEKNIDAGTALLAQISRSVNALDNSKLVEQNMTKEQAIIASYNMGFGNWKNVKRKYGEDWVKHLGDDVTSFDSKGHEFDTSKSSLKERAQYTTGVLAFLQQIKSGKYLLGQGAENIKMIGTFVEPIVENLVGGVGDAFNEAKTDISKVINSAAELIPDAIDDGLLTVLHGLEKANAWLVSNTPGAELPSSDVTSETTINSNTTINQEAIATRKAEITVEELKNAGLLLMAGAFL